MMLLLCYCVECGCWCFVSVGRRFVLIAPVLHTDDDSLKGSMHAQAHAHILPLPLLPPCRAAATSQHTHNYLDVCVTYVHIREGSSGIYSMADHHRRLTLKEEGCTPAEPTIRAAAGSTSNRCRWRSSRSRRCWSSGTTSRRCCWCHRACCTCFPESSVGDGAQAWE